MRLFGFDLSVKRSNAPRDPALAELLGGDSNSSGVMVTPTTAMRSSAVYACVRVLSETLASLPLKMFRKLQDGSKEEVTDHPLAKLVHRVPNTWQSASEFRDQMTMHAALRGAAYARILIEPNGTRRLVPLHPDKIKAHLTADLRLIYEYWDGAQRVPLIQGDVLRLPYLVREGVDPVSPVRLHAETIGMALASSRYTNSFLKNGGRPPGYIKMDQAFKDPEQRRKFKEFLQGQIGGKAQGSTLILEQGDYKAIGISNADAQLLDICKMTLLDICRIYRVPPHMAGDLDRATWSNVEQQSIDFVVHTIGPWLVRWEQALSRDLLTDDEQQEYYFEFNVDGLLRGDIKTRYSAYAQGRQWGWLSINDVRARENMNKIENGDDYLSPTNMIPAWQVGNQPEQPDGNGKTPPPV